MRQPLEPAPSHRTALEAFKNWAKPRRRYRILAGVALLALGGCSVGPKYARPSAEVPRSFKEASGWKVAQPSAAIGKGEWWKVYSDPELDSLERQITVSDQTLKIAQERFVQARAAIGIAHAPALPNVTAGVAGSRNRQSQNRALFGGAAPVEYSDVQLPVDASYEPDVWGRVRRSVEAAHSEAQASAADLASVDLSLHAELALDYFQLRGLDSQAQLLDSTVVSYEKALELTQNRYQGGLSSELDVAQAQTQLETTRAEAVDVGVQRAAFEHAIAVLIGTSSASFTLQPLPLTLGPPSISAGLPSDLLERRPDIAAAERRVEEANAQIGVARAAYFPNLLLTGSGGFESTTITNLLSGASGFWSLAGSAAELVFDGGARRGINEQVRSVYRASVDQYRQTTLVAFQEVEDNLAALRILESESKVEDAAVTAAQHALDLSSTRYKGGVANYLEVTTAESVALNDERAAVDIATRRMTASVLLIKALGGGWDVAQIPRL
ncbi:MAG: efflux transporter outer membrane subunit [Acidobacteriota bacterium]|nr:efflux transporter outer membrane subunit [Acidobacteriota bacterium]